MTIRKDKEKLIIYLYKQGKPVRQIAKEAESSFRDISATIKKYLEKEEAQKQIERYNLNVSEAYQLFSEGKTPLQVAIKLQIREHTVFQIYQEFIHLSGMTKLSLIYDKLWEYPGGIDYFVSLSELALSRGIGKREVMNLLRISNGDLPSLYEKLEDVTAKLKAVEYTIKCRYQELELIIHKIEKERKTLDHYLQLSNSVTKDIEKKQIENSKLTEFNDRLKSNDECIKIKKQIIKEIEDIFRDKQELLIIAIYSVITYIRDPDKRNSLLDNTVLFSKLVQEECNGIEYSHYTSISDTKEFDNNSPKEPYKKQILNEIKEIYYKTILELGKDIMQRLFNCNYEREGYCYDDRLQELF